MSHIDLWGLVLLVSSLPHGNSSNLSYLQRTICLQQTICSFVELVPCMFCHGCALVSIGQPRRTSSQVLSRNGSKSMRTKTVSRLLVPVPCTAWQHLCTSYQLPCRCSDLVRLCCSQCHDNELSSVGLDAVLIFPRKCRMHHRTPAHPRHVVRGPRGRRGDNRD